MGNVYMRPNDGTTDYGIDLGQFDGPVCVRAASLSIGSNGVCNFPAKAPELSKKWLASPLYYGRHHGNNAAVRQFQRAWELISRMPTARLGLASVRMRGAQ